MPETKIFNELSELLDVLQADSDFIKENIDNLKILRELVVKRDDKSLTELLERIQHQSQQYSKNVEKRLELRRKIASALGWKVEEVRLSKLEPMLEEQTKQFVIEMRKNLEKLSNEIKAQVTGTSMLLRELSRFNSMVLNTILEGGQFTEITYNKGGAKKQYRSNGIVNMRL